MSENGNEVTLSKEEYQRLVAVKQLQDEIQEAEKAAMDARNRWEDSKAQTNDRKKVYDQRVEELHSIIQEADSGQMRLDLKNSDSDPVEDACADADTDGFAPSDWQSVEVGKLNVSKAIVDSLRELGVETAGDVEIVLNGGDVGAIVGGIQGQKHWGAQRVKKLTAALEELRGDAGSANAPEQSSKDKGDLVQIKIIGDNNIIETAGLKFGGEYAARISGGNATVSSEETGEVTLLDGEWELVEEPAMA